MFDFSNIDSAIQQFRKDKYGIYISQKAKTDWFAFQYRSIEWKKEQLNFILEVFPDLDEIGESISWNLGLMINYDENNRKYFYKEKFAKSETFEVVEKIFAATLIDNYEKYNSGKLEQIEFEFIEL